MKSVREILFIEFIEKKNTNRVSGIPTAALTA
jgi:hypothetical protein